MAKYKFEYQGKKYNSVQRFCDEYGIEVQKARRLFSSGYLPFEVLDFFATQHGQSTAKHKFFEIVLIDDCYFVKGFTGSRLNDKKKYRVWKNSDSVLCQGLLAVCAYVKGFEDSVKEALNYGVCVNGYFVDEAIR